MADTWMTPTRKNDLIKYIDDLKKISGGPVEEEDLYAAGFSEKDLQEIGWFNEPPKASTMSGDGSKLEAYEPTSRDNLRNNVSGALRELGLDKQLARSVAVTVAGEENPTDGGLGMGLADFTPYGALFGAEEGSAAVKRGVKSGDYASAGLGALEAVDSIASAIPGVKVASKGVQKIAEHLAGQYDPSVTRTFFGPTSAKADLTKLEVAKKLSAEGADEQAVWEETGWWNGPNGWRFEVDDSQMPMPYGSTETNMYGPTQDVVVHKDFWESLSPREDMLDDDATVDAFDEQDIRRRVIGGGDTTLGPMDAGKDYKGVFRPDTSNMEAYGYTPEDQKETLVHELQHAIQYVFGDKGSGANPDYIQRQFKSFFEELPTKEQAAARAATELGYSKARLEEIEKRIPIFQERVDSEANLDQNIAHRPWWSKETPADNAKFLQELIEEKESLTRKVQFFSETLKKEAQKSPEFAEAISEFETLGNGVGLNYLRGPRSSSRESLISDRFILEGNGLKPWASNELYYLENGELEARIAGSRANLSPEERKSNNPGLYFDLNVENRTYSLPDFENWLSVILEDAKKSAGKGYAKGGVVEEKDPISGNPVPPGAQPEEVRDDVDAKLSEGEYVIPADVVRYLGLDKIEKLVAQAKESLAEMEKNGRIGGEPVEEPDDLPFSDEELMSSPEEAPVGMAMGGLVATGDRIRSGIGLGAAPNPTAGEIPPWMMDQNVPEQKPRPKGEYTEKLQQRPLTGLAGSVETWSARDFTNAVKQRSGDPGVGMVEKLVKSVPLGGLALRARHKYLDKAVPGAIDNMLKSGKDVDGTPLSKEQVASLQKARTDFTATAGYKPGGLKAVAKDAVKSIIGPREKTDKTKETNKSESAADKKTDSKSTNNSANKSESRRGEGKDKKK